LIACHLFGVNFSMSVADGGSVGAAFGASLAHVELIRNKTVTIKHSIDKNRTAILRKKLRRRTRLAA